MSTIPVPLANTTYHSSSMITSNGKSSDNESSSDWQNVQLPNKYRRLIDRINDRIKAGVQFFSLEYFPPRTTEGAANLVTRYNKLVELL